MWSPLSALAVVAALATAPSSPRITDLREITLQSGINIVPRLAPDGRDGVIVEAAPHVEVADQSHTDFMVLVKPTKPGDDWAVARVIGFAKSARDEAEPEDLVSDYPHTGEDQLSSVRFARAMVDGVAAVVLIRAQRDFVLPIPDPSPVSIDIFRLMIDPDFGEERFERVGHRRYPGGRAAAPDGHVHGLHARLRLGRRPIRTSPSSA